MIKNVIFDIGMVLLTFNWDEYVHRLFNDEEIEKAVTAATWHNSDAWKELDRGVLTAEEVCRLFEQAGKGYEAQVRLAFEHMGECPVQQPYAVPWIEELKAKGLSVYYLSNYSDHLLNACPEALSFTEHTDGGIYSYEVKLIKPDPEIYRRLCEKYSLTPSECLFIDDLAANVEGAKSCGLNAIQFDCYEKSYPEIMKFIGI
ncbi:MAG: HAD family phosphatase [Oscillospiraceae bacterium]|nr:HAD family phosphatase [Oscillospiraceae bacterium]